MLNAQVMFEVGTSACGIQPSVLASRRRPAGARMIQNAGLAILTIDRLALAGEPHPE